MESPFGKTKVLQKSWFSPQTPDPQNPSGKKKVFGETIAAAAGAVSAQAAARNSSAAPKWARADRNRNNRVEKKLVDFLFFLIVPLAVPTSSWVTAFRCLPGT